MSDWVEVRRGGYHDSVTLMRVSRQLAERPGVAGAMVAMATRLNREMFERMGFAVPDDAGPDDLVVAVRVDGGGLDEAREALDGLLRDASRPPAGGRGASRSSPSGACPLYTTYAADGEENAALRGCRVPNTNKNTTTTTATTHQH
ncbi:hypothetical protein HUX53_38945, partial [Actinomadura sp. BRA 177]|nr:hypothetical protein [Actinomadura sp. BRA 177]